MKIKVSTEQEVIAKINSLLELIKQHQNLLKAIVNFYNYHVIKNNSNNIIDEELELHSAFNMVYGEIEPLKKLSIYVNINNCTRVIRIVAIISSDYECTHIIDFETDKESLKEIINDLISNYTLKGENIVNKLIEFRKE